MGHRALQLLFFSFALICTSVKALGQANEVSFSIGAVSTSDQNATSRVLGFACPVSNPDCGLFSTRLRSDTALGFEGTYARRLARAGVASFYAELPLVGIPGHDVNAQVSPPPGVTIAGNTTFSSSSILFTPSARVKFFDSSAVSPFASVGGGLAHSSTDTQDAGGLFSFASNTGALQFGGGIDFGKRSSRLGFRAEVRDFYFGSGAQASSPALGVQTSLDPERLHHLFAGGGMVVRF